MTDRIARQINDLRHADHLRREIVTHVSHDLRTPLTSLQGYLETLPLKNGDLPPGEREEILRVALLHCRRISILVSELFELSMLDSPDVAVRHGRFPPGDLVQDVLQKFRSSVSPRRGKRSTFRCGSRKGSLSPLEISLSWTGYWRT